MFWRDLSNFCFISNILGLPFGGLIISLYLRISKTKDMAQKDNKLILYKDIEGQVKRQ
jgi:hypothetical protein